MTIELLIIFLLLFISHTIFLSIVLSNVSNAPRIKNIKGELKNRIDLSILVPARNEEKNIIQLLDSLLVQTYPINEIIILDDHSTDKTTALVESYIKDKSKIKLLTGKELPENWLGKNWACQQLAENASGNYMLFLDSDVSLSNYAIENAVEKFLKNKLSMLSVFPTQKIKSMGEWIVVPLMNWFLITFLPLKMVFTTKSEKYSAANGQFILIEKNMYEKIGGHAAVKEKIVEDVMVSKLVKRSGGKLMTCLGEDAVSCRMYSSFNEAITGFSKNFYLGFEMPKVLFLLFITTLFFLFFIPLLLLFVNYIFILIVFMIALERIFVSIISKQNWFFNLVLHLVQIPVMFFIGLNSLFNKEIKWKGRSI